MKENVMCFKTNSDEVLALQPLIASTDSIDMIASCQYRVDASRKKRVKQLTASILFLGCTKSLTVSRTFMRQFGFILRCCILRNYTV